MDDIPGVINCPDDDHPMHPMGGVVDPLKLQVVFFACCPVCTKAGRAPTTIARVNVTSKEAIRLVAEGMPCVSFAEAA